MGSPLHSQRSRRSKAARMCTPVQSSFQQAMAVDIGQNSAGSIEAKTIRSALSTNSKRMVSVEKKDGQHYMNIYYEGA